MDELDDLIRYENENSSLDFKAVQYTKPMYEALVKDIMAMANANVPGDRFIVVGVKHRPDGTREVFSIDEKDFVDAATYQQLIRDNVEPEIHFDYSPYRFEGQLLGVFRIFGCEEQPYMMRKDFGNLRKGDAYIRKGSHQPRLIREDLDRIIKKQTDRGFTGVITVGFDAPGAPTEISLPSVGNIKYPSDMAADRIRGILTKRAKAGDEGRVDTWRAAAMASFNSLRGTPYEARETDELEKNLASVKKTYKEDDLYTLYEQHSAKVNFTVINEGQTYVEDASIRAEFPKFDGLRIARKVYHLPDRSGPLGIASVHPNFLDRYPSVSEDDQLIIVRNGVGDLRHGIPTRAFSKALRIALDNELVGETIELRCKIFGKQLRSPLVETLKINVVSPKETG